MNNLTWDLLLYSDREKIYARSVFYNRRRFFQKAALFLYWFSISAYLRLFP